MMKKIIFMALLIFCFESFVYAQENYPFAQAVQEAQFRHLISELRCMVCQHQNLAESDAPLAQDMKHLIYQKVLAGESDSQIQTYLTIRYGDAILFKPPLKVMTLGLWFAPVLFLFIGVVIFIHNIKRSKD